MDLSQPVRDRMTPTPKVVRLADDLTDAWTEMLNGGFHHLPVVDGDRKVIGMLSKTDLAVALDGLDPTLKDTGVVLDDHHGLQDLMTRDVVWVGPDASLRDVAVLLAQGRFHAVPVVDLDERLLGIVTTTDLVGWMLEDAGEA